MLRIVAPDSWQVADAQVALVFVPCVEFTAQIISLEGSLFQVKSRHQCDFSNRTQSHCGPPISGSTPQDGQSYHGLAEHGPRLLHMPAN